MEEECYPEPVHLIRLVEIQERQQATDSVQTIHLRSRGRNHDTEPMKAQKCITFGVIIAKY